MFQELFDKQRTALNFFYEKIDAQECDQLFASILKCNTLFFTGVGKSGLIAQKIAATIASMGIAAHFLNPTDALHGDLGLVEEGDGVLFLSKSGQAQKLIEAAHEKKAMTFAVTSTEKSPLATQTHHSLLLPCASELCPFDLVPTTSAAVQLLFGDALAIALLEEKGVTLEQYAQNHPLGRIGKRATLKVKDVMLEKEQLPLCTSKDRLIKILDQITEKKCGCVMVVDENKQLEGIITDGDLRRALQQKGDAALQQRVADLMTRAPRTAAPNTPAWEAMQRMEQHSPVMVLPIVEEEEVVGLLKLHDLVQAGL